MEIQDNISKAIEFYRTRYLIGEERKKMHERRIGFVQGAEWKDWQFKEYLEKNRTNYPDFMNGTDTYAFGMKEGYVKAFDKIINELLNKE